VTGFGSIDGSTYNPFTRTLLFTQEQGTSQRTGQGKVIQLSVNWPPRLNTLEAFLGLGGYEGIHLDDSGNVYIVEDIGGARNATTQAGQPNSFVYRYVPNDPRVLENGGALQALQVTVDGKPVTFHASDVNGDIMAEAQLKLHTYGASFPIKWVTIHTSHAGDTAAFDANAAAKAAGATPFKRPENLAWLPGSDFRTFFFAPTGDTNSLAGENADLAARGAWGSIFRVDLRGRSNEYGEHGERGEDSFRHRGPSNSDGEISLFVLGDREHNSFDNLTIANEKTLLAGEDRGDTLHQQLNTLDSVWAFTVKKHGSHDDEAAPKAVRFIALGRDAKAVAKGEDNEPTGVLVSNGGAGREDLLGTERSLENARGFFTQQHGDNNLFGIFRIKGHDERASRDDDK
jgi:hypothetical protein